MFTCYRTIFGSNYDFCADGFYYEWLHYEKPRGRWWWSDALQQVCTGPVEMHTGMWDSSVFATNAYLKLLNREVTVVE